MSESAARTSRYPFTPYPIGWFRACYADELLPGQVKRLQILGRELVAFRGEGGEEARILDAHCPHLGAHLGVGGEVVGDGIRCPFHHWEFDGDGRCRKIPYAKRIPPRAEIATWPVRERNGVVFLWHHPERAEPTFELPELSELEDPDWLPLDICRWEVRANWLDMNENCVDQAHFKFVHGTLSIPPTTAEIEGHVHRATSLFRMKMPGGEGDATLVTEDHGPGFQLVRQSGLIDSLMMNTCTPIDEELTDVSFAYTVRTGGDERKARLAASVVKDLKNQFENDRPIWENKAYWTKPRLCDGDGPFGSYRKWMKQFV